MTGLNHRQEIILFCISYPSDKRAQHELVQAGQKHSTLHRYQGCVGEYPSCVNQKKRTGNNYIFCRSEASLQECTLQIVPSILLKLVENVLSALRFSCGFHAQTPLDTVLSATSGTQCRLNVSKSVFKPSPVRILSRNSMHPDILPAPLLLQRHLPSTPPPPQTPPPPPSFPARQELTLIDFSN